MRIRKSKINMSKNVISRWLIEVGARGDGVVERVG